VEFVLEEVDAKRASEHLVELIRKLCPVLAAHDIDGVSMPVIQNERGIPLSTLYKHRVRELHELRVFLRQSSAVTR